MPVTTHGRRDVPVSPELLGRERDREQSRRELFSRYAGLPIDSFDLRASVIRGDEPLELVNRRLRQSGYRGPLPEPVAEADDPGEPAPQPVAPPRQQAYNAPFGWDADDELTKATPAPEKRVQEPRNAHTAPDSAARQWSRAKGLPSHNVKRRSQTYLGRHIRTVRARALRLGVTEAVADRDLIHRRADQCVYRNPALLQDPS